MQTTRSVRDVAGVCLIAVGVAVGIVAVAVRTAAATQPIRLSPAISCGSDHTQRAVVGVINPNFEDAVILSTTIPNLAVGTVIPAHHGIQVQFSEPGGFVGDVDLSVTFNTHSYPTHITTDAVLHFDGHCSPTSTTGPPETIPKCEVPHPQDCFATSTTAKSTSTTAKSSTMAPPAEAVTVPPAFTG